VADIDVDAVLSGDSSVTAEVGVSYAIAASLSGDSSVTVEGRGSYKVASTLVANSNIDADSRVSHLVYSTLVGSSSLVGGLKAALESSLAGNSSLVAAATLEVGGYAAPIRYQPPSRIVTSGRLILESVDLFTGDGKTRVTEIPVTDLQLKIFCNNDLVSWPLVSGSGIPDVRITAGKVYWTEGADGFYSVRFYPSVIGMWRVLLTYQAYDQAISLTYDVVPKVSMNPSTGIRTSFIRK
jgi:hypothetical protein